jgi:hypothetical protein
MWLEHGFRRRSAGKRPSLDEEIGGLFDPEPSHSFEAVAADLRPVVRPRAILEATRLTIGADALHWPAAGMAVLAELGEHLVVVAAIERPPAIQLRLAADAAAWGLSPEAVLARAMENLAGRPIRFEPAEGGFLLSACDDPYHAARMLRPELFTGLGLKGATIAVPMMSDWVAVCGAEDVDALLAMSQFVGKTVEQDMRGFGFGPMILDGGAWRPFEPEAPELRPVLDLWKRQQVWDYRSQDEALQQWLGRHEPGCMAATTEAGWFEGQLFTATPWGQEWLPVLMPMVDVVSMAPVDDEPIIRSWADVAVAVRLNPEPGHWPPRVRADAWPDAEAWSVLKACPEPPGFVGQTRSAKPRRR